MSNPMILSSLGRLTITPSFDFHVLYCSIDSVDLLFIDQHGLRAHNLWIDKAGVDGRYFALLLLARSALLS